MHKIHGVATVAFLITLSTCVQLSGVAFDGQHAAGAWVHNPANGHYYCLTGVTTWEEAREVAEGWGGYLATINDAEENIWLVNTSGLLPFGASYWIGLTDKDEEDTWMWVNGETATYRNWGPDEPNDWNNNEDYVELLNQYVGGKDPGDWNDSTPAQENIGVVERDTDPPEPSVHYVSRIGDNSAGDSWATALHSIHDAVELATVTEGEVWVAEGTYNISSAAILPSDIVLYGGFPATDDASFADRDPREYVTSLDGQGAIGNLFVCDAVTNVRIDGFTLTGAIGSGSGYGAGGAIVCTGGSANVTIENCIITMNNITTGWGAGLNLYYSSANVTNCEFSHNSAGSAGAICMHRAEASIVDSRFEANVSHGHLAGGISNYDSPLEVHRCIFLNNRGIRGGAMECHEGDSAIVTNSLFAGNYTRDRGGAIWFDDERDTKIANCTFVDNGAASGGGAVIILRGAGSIVNSIFAANRNVAIHDAQNNPKPTIKNCLFFNNPDGIYYDETVTVQSATGPEGLNILLAEAKDNLDGDPLFVNPAADNYHLQTGSPCVDAGTSEDAPADDVDGESRPADIAVDIGFDEVVDTDEDGMSDWWENDYGLDALLDDKDADPDADGLTNAEEYFHGTDPFAADTDGDGYTDLEEVGHGSDPTSRLRDPVYVSRTGDNTTGDSWETALYSIHDAVALAETHGKNVWIGAGTYNIGSAVALPSGVSIYGGFPPSDNPGFFDRAPAAYVTTLDGQGAVGHMFVCESVHSIRIDGFTLTGSAGNDDGYLAGGSVICSGNSSDVNLVNCVFADNTGIYGGGINLVESSAVVEYCEFRDNDASDSGGGIHLHRAQASVRDCLFEHNEAEQLGGGISAYATYLDVDRCVFRNNESEKGGALECHEGDVVVIANCLVTKNYATLHGGALNFESQQGIEITNCTLVANTADDRAGGILLHNSSGEVVNTILLGNTKHAIYENDDRSDPLVKNCLFYDNPDGVYFNEGAATIAEVAGPDGLNAVLAEAQNNMDGDPLFADPAGGDYHLRPTSPCIDSGTEENAPATDIDGELRPVDILGTGQDGTGMEYDIGYDEFIDTDGDGLVDIVETNTGEYVDAGDTGTDPNLADTDSDGLDDGIELVYGTNPVNMDSDDDGLLDGDEGMDDVDDDGIPNCLDTDSDGDDVPDAEENEAGSNPYDERDTPYPFGDVDRSGDVNAVDVQLVINAVLGISEPPWCDLDWDDLVNAVDVQLAVNSVLGIL